jgi:hypothetical protein
VAKGEPGKPWTVVNPVRESGLTVEKFLEGFGQDPKREFGPPPPKRLTNPRPPSDLPRKSRVGAVDLQDNVAVLARPGEWTEIRPDSAASDGRAVWMPGRHKEWACMFVGNRLPEKAQNGRWDVYAVVRIERGTEVKPDTLAFSAGVYDEKARQSLASLSASPAQAGEGYHSHLIGTIEMNPDCAIYVAPGANDSVRAVWVDRVFLVPAR